MLWPPEAKSWLISKDPDAGKDWRQEEKERTDDEMVGWHCRLDGYEFEEALGLGDGQGSLVCFSPWGCKELDTTEWLNCAGVQLQQPGIQPEEVDGVGEWDSLSFFYGLPLYSKFKILFYTFTKALGQRFDIFRSPSPRFIISINNCCSSNRVPASVILWESALSSIIYLF